MTLDYLPSSSNSLAKMTADVAVALLAFSIVKEEIEAILFLFSCNDISEKMFLPWQKHDISIAQFGFLEGFLKVPPN